MKVLGIWVPLIFLLAALFQEISSVKVVVIREDPNDKSVESSREGTSHEESEEIDMLMDLIEKEARDRKPAPVTTVRVVKRKPSKEMISEHSFRKEKIEKPNEYKEYHIHYHNHQHKSAGEKPSLSVSDAHLHPVIWDSPFSHVTGFKDYEPLSKPYRLPSTPYYKSPKVRTFKDLELFLQSKLRNVDTSGRNYETKRPRETYHEYDAYEEQAALRSKKVRGNPFDRLKEFDEFLNSDCETEDINEDFPNKGRFETFTDFSNIESPDPKDEPPENDDENKKDRAIDIKDFAIVIKTKPRTSPSKDQIENKPQDAYKEEHTDVNSKTQTRDTTFGVQRNPPFKMPRILEAPGGAPKYIERLNLMKYADQEYRNAVLRNNLPHNLNSLENERMKLLPLNRVPNRIFSNFQRRSPINGWLIRRLLRR
ncbi:uncharacterized protein LOC118203508 [Stegodyphus dumicola]|uniref:uncharacterized protein LOC118203508 n=1 Tax=Stegodyphus dumicola TaxID=202533 RepID=UPI0015ABB289|nr:uncharacterized protein LOC118203508 [Stegodyphus dumicola]